MGCLSPQQPLNGPSGGEALNLGRFLWVWPASLVTWSLPLMSELPSLLGALLGVPTARSWHRAAQLTAYPQCPEPG